MPKRILTPFAKLFAKPPTPPLTHWPRKWPSPHKDLRASRTSHRSQLRFTPIAAGKIEPWIFQLLLGLQELLAKGENEDAIALCHDELSVATYHRDGQYDCYHRVISLFTRHDDFEAAISLCNRMIQQGFVVPNKTLMVLLRGMHAHDVRHVRQVHQMLTSGAVELDDLGFRAILDSMFVHGSTPEDLEAALKAYSATRDNGWVAPISIYGTVIQSHALAGQLDRAQQWLDEYRRTAVKSLYQSLDAASPCTSPENATSELPDPLERQLELKLRRRSGIRPSTENPHYPYAAVLMGYVKSPVPVSQRIQWLLQCMQSDGMTPDIDMYNMLILAFLRWGRTHRALAVYQSVLSPDSDVLPDAYTFRHLFIALNPKQRRARREVPLPTDISARELFKDMVALDRLRLHPRRPQPHRDIISTATFNCALGTFIAQGDYAAAWTVLAYFTRFHLSPSTQTFRNIFLSLLRRMRSEVAQKSTIGEVIWMDRFTGERRWATETPDRMMLADYLLMIGHAAVTDSKLARFETYLKPSPAVRGPTKAKMELCVALLRISLQASLGYPRNTIQTVVADKAIRVAMSQARSDMIPKGRSGRN